MQRLGFGNARQALRPFIGPRFRWMIAGAVALGTALGVVEAVILQTIGELVGFIEVGDSVRSLGPIRNLTATQLTMIGLGASVVLVILRFAETVLTARIGVHPLTIARSRLASSFLSTDFRSQQQVNSGTYYELVLAHAVRLGSLSMALATMISSAAVAIALSITAAIVSPVAFALITAVVALVVISTAPLNSLAQRLGSRLAAARNDLANESGETVNGATDARLFAVESQVLDALNRRIHEVSNIAFKNHAVTQFGPGLFQALMLGVLVVVTGIIASQNGEGFASAGTVTLLAIRAQMAARKVIATNVSIATSAPFAFELRDQIERLPKRPSQGTKTLKSIEDFEAVGIAFSYPPDGPATSQTHAPTKALLANLDLRIRKGEHVGILGPSGSGKSTLLTILLGLVEPQQGAVLLNGVDRRDYSEESTRRHIAAVQQQPKLVTATVAENIRYFRDDVSDDAVSKAARDAGILDEVTSWPDGLQTIVGERGARQVSGGQAQRICIARALAGNPSLLIMDEPTSSIDESGEQLIVDTLAALGDSCAAIIVSHRPASLGSCDRLLTLRKNRLVDLPQ